MVPAKLTVRQNVVASAVAVTEVMSWRTGPVPVASPTVSVTENRTFGVAGQATVGVAAGPFGRAACRCHAPLAAGAGGAGDGEDAVRPGVDAKAGDASSAPSISTTRAALTLPRKRPTDGRRLPVACCRRCCTVAPAGVASI
jgi:hypothetical protein